MSNTNTRHKQELKLAIRRTRGFLNKQRYHPRHNVMADTVILGLMSKAVKVAEGVVVLLDAGLPDEAFGLSRTLVEAALSLRFITNRYTERRARRFARYAGKWKVQMMRRLERLTPVDAHGQSKPKYTKAQLRKMMPNYNLMLKWARGYPQSPSAHWSQARYGSKGKKAKKSSTWALATEADGHEKLNGQPVNWQFDYEWIYSWTSQYVHVTAACMDSHITQPMEAFRVQIAPYRTPVAGPAVFNTTLYLYKILRMAFPAIGQPFPVNLSHSLEELLVKMTSGK
jgi:Family of unknown function (DUF5677)